jgi:hypothetical protein
MTCRVKRSLTSINLTYFDRLSKSSMTKNRLRTLVLYCWRLNIFVTSKTENGSGRKLRNLTWMFIVQNSMKLDQDCREHLDAIIFFFVVLTYSPFLIVFLFSRVWLKQCHWNYRGWIANTPTSARPLLGGYHNGATTAPYNFHSKLWFM